MPIDNKKIHKHLKHISHINTMLAVASLIGLLAIVLWVRASSDTAQGDTIIEPDTVNAVDQEEVSKPASQVEAADAVDTEELTTEYRTEINAILEGYHFDDSTRAEELSYAALELRVPAELKQMHLQIILALNKAQQGDFAGAQEIIAQLQNEFAWFNQ